MSSYDRVLSAVGHRRPDRVPLELIAVEEVKRSLIGALKVQGEEELLRRLGVDFRRVELAVRKAQPVPPRAQERFGGQGSLEASCYGVVLLKHPNFPQHHRVYGPFYDSENLDHFDWPEPDDVESPQAAAAAIARHNREGLCTLVPCDNPFKIAYFMRPYEEFLIDCLTRPEFACELLERIATVEFTRAMNGVRAGARCVMIFGDFAHQQELMVSPAVFRRVLKPLLAGFVARLKNVRPEVLVFLHSDGNLTSVLEDLIECGFDAVHPIQPECMDMAVVKRRFGDRLTLFGGVSVQSELPGSDPQVIRALVRRRIELLGQNGGFILAPSNSIMPDVPTASVLAIYEEGGRIRK